MSGAICVCMILKNARHLLPEALDALVPLAPMIGQYVFVDTGSSDNSPAYIRQRLPEAEIIVHTWCDNFSEARNRALDQANTSWALFLDADERLAPESVPVLQQLLKQPLSIEGVVCRRENLDLEGNPVSWDALTRVLSVSPSLRFTGAVHERPVMFEASSMPNAPAKARPLVVQSEPGLRLTHVATPPQTQTEKTHYYLTLIQKERQHWPSPLMDYHWAITPNIQQTTPPQERLSILRQALEETLTFEAAPCDLPYPQWAGVPVAACILECQFLMIEADQYPEMLRFFEAYQSKALLAESWGQAALAHDQEGHWLKAQQCFYRALDPQHPMMDPTQGWGSWRSHAFLATLYERAEDWPAAWAHSTQALRQKPLPHFVRALTTLQQHLTARMAMTEAQQVLQNAFQQAKALGDHPALLSLACFLLSLNAAAEEKDFLAAWDIPHELQQSPFYAWFNTLIN